MITRPLTKEQTEWVEDYEREEARLDPAKKKALTPPKPAPPAKPREPVDDHADW